MKHEKQPFNEFELYARFSRVAPEVGAEAVDQVVEIEAVEAEDLSEAA